MIKKALLTGLIIVLPIFLTFALFVFFLEFLTSPFIELARDFLLHSSHGPALILIEHPLILAIFCRISILIALLLTLFILGFLGRYFLFRAFLKFSERLFSRIPFIKNIYKLLDQITKSFIAPDKRPFQGTILFSFPDEHTKALGLLIGEAPKVLSNKERPLQSLFVPTSPHPVSGFILFTEKKHLSPVDISTENLFKFLLSCGLCDLPSPEQTPPETPPEGEQ